MITGPAGSGLSCDFPVPLELRVMNKATYGSPVMGAL